MKRRSVFLVGLALVAIAAICIPLLLHRHGRERVTQKEWACFDHLCSLQSVFTTYTGQKQLSGSDSVSVEQLRIWWGPRYWQDCRSGGKYLLPPTVGSGRPTCGFHGDLLTKYGYPDEKNRRDEKLSSRDSAPLP